MRAREGSGESWVDVMGLKRDVGVHVDVGVSVGVGVLSAGHSSPGNDII